MNKKRFIPFLLIPLLFGCTVKVEDIPKIIEKNVASESQTIAAFTTNRHRYYFDYYLPRCVGERVNTDLVNENVELLLNGTSFYMSLDVAEVVISEYYDEYVRYKTNYYDNLSKIGDIIVHRYGDMKNDYNEIRRYQIIVSELDESDYFVYVSFGDVYFVSLCSLSEIGNMVDQMLAIGSSVKIERESILLNYSNKVNKSITGSYDLFDEYFPESGMLADIVNKDNDVTENFSNEYDEFGDEYEYEDEEYEDELIENENNEMEEE